MGIYDIEYFDIDEQGDGSWELAFSLNNFGEACRQTIKASKEEQVTFWRIHRRDSEWTLKDGFYFDGDFYIKDIR